MNTATLIDTIRRQGIELKAEGGNLLFRPRGRVTPELRAEIVTHKIEIVALLQSQPAPTPSCSALVDLYRTYWSTPETEPMTTFQSLHREIDSLERQVGVDTAWRTLEAAARGWYEQQAACPFCGTPGAFHFPGASA